MKPIIKAIIIEDEAPARKLLRHFLENFERDIEVVCECEDGFDGVKMILNHQPDLVFLDVQMPRINGFEMLELLDKDKLPIVIFTTAFDEFAIKAFEYNAVDYLLKPLGKERFDKAVGKAIGQIRTRQDESKGKLGILLEHAISKEKFLERIVIRTGNQIQVVQCDDIICLESSDDYVVIHTVKEQWIKKQTLKFYEARLNPEEFLRVHRSFILKLSEINRLEPYSKDAYIAILHNGLKVSVSKAGYLKLKESLNF
jgi:two-component system, LytTR family, response regulator